MNGWTGGTTGGIHRSVHRWTGLLVVHRCPQVGPRVTDGLLPPGSSPPCPETTTPLAGRQKGGMAYPLFTACRGILRGKGSVESAERPGFCGMRLIASQEGSVSKDDNAFQGRQGAVSRNVALRHATLETLATDGLENHAAFRRVDCEVCMGIGQRSHEVGPVLCDLPVDVELDLANLDTAHDEFRPHAVNVITTRARDGSKTRHKRTSYEQTAISRGGTEWH